MEYARPKLLKLFIIKVWNVTEVFVIFADDTKHFVGVKL